MRACVRACRVEKNVIIGVHGSARMPACFTSGGGPIAERELEGDVYRAYRSGTLAESAVHKHHTHTLKHLDMIRVCLLMFYGDMSGRAVFVLSVPSSAHFVM